MLYRVSIFSYSEIEISFVYLNEVKIILKNKNLYISTDDEDSKCSYFITRDNYFQTIFFQTIYFQIIQKIILYK